MKRKGYKTPDVRVNVMITADVLNASGYVADGDGGQYFEDFFPTQS